MPFVIKHKTQDRYICGTKSNKRDFDANGLVSIEFAQVYATEQGAKSALRSWASVWDNNAFDSKRAQQLRATSELDEHEIMFHCTGAVVVDEAKRNMVEIVAMKLV